MFLGTLISTDTRWVTADNRRWRGQKIYPSLEVIPPSWRQKEALNILPYNLVIRASVRVVGFSILRSFYERKRKGRGSVDRPRPWESGLKVTWNNRFVRVTVGYSWSVGTGQINAQKTASRTKLQTPLESTTVAVYVVYWTPHEVLDGHQILLSSQGLLIKRCPNKSDNRAMPSQLCLSWVWKMVYRFWHVMFIINW